MHSGKAGDYKHLKLFVCYNGCDYDYIVSWTVHIKDHASDPVSLSLIMFLVSKDVIVVGMRVHRHCSTPVFENHPDGKAPDDKITHVLIEIYCFWTSSLAQLSQNFGHL